MTKLLIFDFDGVIVDSLGFYFDAWCRTVKAFGRQELAEREAFLSLLDGNFYESLGRQGRLFWAFPEIGNRIHSTFGINRVAPFPEIPETLRLLSLKKSMALVSSNNSFMIKSVLERHGMGDIFNPILGADNERLKEHKIDMALETHNVSAEESVYICDTVGDIHQARKTGVRVAAVTWGWHDTERLARANPHIMINSPKELMDL